MDIYDLRQRNMRLLIRDRFDGNQSKFAGAVGKKPDYISRCLSSSKHRKRIGEDIARGIEKALLLEANWMDLERQSAALPAPPAIETRPEHEVQGRELTAREEMILDMVCKLTKEQQGELLPHLRAAVHANVITQKHLKNGLKTVGNHRMEEEFGLPAEKEKGRM